MGKVSGSFNPHQIGATPNKDKKAMKSNIPQTDIRAGAAAAKSLNITSTSTHIYKPSKEIPRNSTKSDYCISGQGVGKIASDVKTNCDVKTISKVGNAISAACDLIKADSAASTKC